MCFVYGLVGAVTVQHCEVSAGGVIVCFVYGLVGAVTVQHCEV